MSLTDIVVHGTIGSGGNHVRWLLLMDKKFNFYNLNNIGEKINFIKKFVYPKTRNHKNWLEYEWRYRKSLNKYITFGHTCWANGWEHRMEDFSKYNVYVNSNDANLLLELYSKFNPTLNNMTREEFLYQALNEHNESICCLTNWHKGIQVDTKILYQEILDETLYKNLITYCNLDNNYEYCNQIHNLWFNLHAGLV